MRIQFIQIVFTLLSIGYGMPASSAPQACLDAFAKAQPVYKTPDLKLVDQLNSDLNKRLIRESSELKNI